MRRRTVKSINFYDENAELLDWLLCHTENFSDLVKVILYAAMHQANAPPARDGGPSLKEIGKVVRAAIRQELGGRVLAAVEPQDDVDIELENNLEKLF